MSSAAGSRRARWRGWRTPPVRGGAARRGHRWAGEDGGLGPAGLAVAATSAAQRAANTLTGRMEQMAGHAGMPGANPYAQPAGSPRYAGHRARPAVPVPEQPEVPPGPAGAAGHSERRRLPARPEVMAHPGGGSARPPGRAAALPAGASGRPTTPAVRLPRRRARPRRRPHRRRPPHRRHPKSTTSRPAPDQPATTPPIGVLNEHGSRHQPGSAATGRPHLHRLAAGKGGLHLRAVRPARGHHGRRPAGRDPPDRRVARLRKASSPGRSRSSSPSPRSSGSAAEPRTNG